MNKFIIKTFGCKTNQIESEYIKELLKNNGYSETSFEKEASFCVVNSCTVTENADKKVLSYINNLKNKNNAIKVIAVGCYCQTHKDEAIKNPNIDVVLGNGEKLKILEYLNKIKYEKVSNIFDENEFEEFIVHHVSRTRATIKIEDGCNNRCSYCIIPFARGKVRSNKLENILNQINILEKNGYSEVVLTGIHIGQWGLDFGLTLNDLLKNIEKTDIKQYRLGSLTPHEIDDEFFEIVSNSQKFCPHFHLSIQSLCDKTLKNMNRHYKAQEVLDLIDKIKKHFPNAFIGCDIIVGFPDETYEDFNNTFDNIKKSKLSKVHVFPYSKRKNTVAFKMENQVSEIDKKERVNLIKELSEKKHNDFLKENLGKTAKIIMEPKKSGEFYKGLSNNYVNILCDERFDGIKEAKFEKIIEDKMLVKVI